MDRASPAGLEVKRPASPDTSPEAVPPFDPNKYYAEAPASQYPTPFPQNQNTQPGTTQRSRRRAYLLLAVIAIVCVAVALGAGLGAGLAAQHKQSSPASASTTRAGSVPVTVTQSGDITTTITPTPSTHPSPSCPAANGSTYVATNKPLPTEVAQVTQSSFSFEILCNTNTAENIDQGGHIMDLQLITNVSSLENCLDECALYNFRTKSGNFPAYGCTGVSWGHGVNLNPTHTCWLKSNVTLGSPNNTVTWPGYDGGVLLTDLR